MGDVVRQNGSFGWAMSVLNEHGTELTIFTSIGTFEGTISASKNGGLLLVKGMLRLEKSGGPTTVENVEINPDQVIAIRPKQPPKTTPQGLAGPTARSVVADRKHPRVK